MSVKGPVAHRRPPTRAWRWLRRAQPLLAVAAVTLLVGGGLTASGAEPPTIPPKGTTGQDSVALLQGVVQVPKTKMVVALPLQVQRVYANESFTPMPTGCGVSGNGTPCEFYRTFSRLWSMTPGATPTYGEFPVVDTYVVGFGALPVRAMIHLTQLVDPATNTYVPFNAIADSLVRAPFTTSTTISGRVVLRLSDVSVDGVSLPVGEACTGESPIDLSFFGGNDYKVTSGGILRGTFTIPPFQGCTDGTQDLDPLFTGTISGPDNTITLRQGPLGRFTTEPGFDQNCAAGNPPNVSPCPTPATLPLTPAATPTG